MITFSQLGRYGRLANQMFQIASTIGIATKNGYEYGFPYWMNYDHLERFGSSEDIDVQKHFINPLPICNIKYPERFVDWGFHGFNIPDNHSLSGHMQSEKYFEHCIDLIKHYFTMTGEYPLQDKIALHIRLGDYDDKYHPRMKWEYYKEAVKHVPNDMPIQVFSDDIQLAKAILGTDFEYSEGGDYLEDFRRMKACRHFIAANSSYSLMAAILGNAEDKIIICPSNWFGDIAGLSTKDIYPKKSIVI